MKAMKKPPNAVKLVMEAVCQMFNFKPEKVTRSPFTPSHCHIVICTHQVKDASGKKVDDYWGVSQKKLLGDPRFLQVFIFTRIHSQSLSSCVPAF